MVRKKYIIIILILIILFFILWYVRDTILEKNIKTIELEYHPKMRELLSNVVEFLNAEKIEYTLAYGTLLGYVRNNKFIRWDDDLDLFVINDNNLDDILDKYNNQNKKFLMTKVDFGYQIGYKNHNTHLDFFVLNKEEKLLKTIKTKNSKEVINKDDFYPIKQGILENIEVNVPNNSHPILTNMYGNYSKARYFPSHSCSKKEFILFGVYQWCPVIFK